jgi:hypothetical protein
VPPLSVIVVVVCSEADRTCKAKVQDVKTVSTSTYLGEKVLLPAPNVELADVDLNLGAVLVELAEADDAVLEMRDEEDAGEHLVGAVLAVEGNRATTLDADHRAVAELDGADNRPIKVREGVLAARHMVHSAVVDVAGISLVLLVFVVLCMVVYCWSLWSFAWWLEGQHLRGQHFGTTS